MAYVSWTLARLIVGKPYTPVTGTRIVALPLVASFIMVAWDLAQDPVWGTVLHGWAWLDGGPWFGVPISNYLGWYGNVFTIYLLFTLYLRAKPAPAIPNRQANWPQPCSSMLFAPGATCSRPSTTPTPRPSQTQPASSGASPTSRAPRPSSQYS